MSCLLSTDSLSFLLLKDFGRAPHTIRFSVIVLKHLIVGWRLQNWTNVYVYVCICYKYCNNHSKNIHAWIKTLHYIDTDLKC